MSENSLTKLREAITAERCAHAFFLTGGDAEFDNEVLCEGRTAAALAAVEQELAALEAERDELRKRPTLEEVLAEMDKVPDKPAGLNFGVAACAMKVTGLYARKAGA